MFKLEMDFYQNRMRELIDNKMRVHLLTYVTSIFVYGGRVEHIIHGVYICRLNLILDICCIGSILIDSLNNRVLSRIGNISSYVTFKDDISLCSWDINVYC